MVLSGIHVESNLCSSAAWLACREEGSLGRGRRMTTVSELGYSTLTGAGAITAGVSCVSRTCRASFNLRGDTAMLLRLM